MGAATLAQKVSNVLHCAKLETGSAANLDSWRYEVYSFTSDHGLEADIADAPCLGNMSDQSWLTSMQKIRASDVAVNSSDAAFSFMFPIAVTINDDLHTFYNALGRAVASAPAWTFMDNACQ
eukprot:2439270-Pyramimonas_sp.AAC.1